MNAAWLKIDAVFRSRNISKHAFQNLFIILNNFTEQSSKGWIRHPGEVFIVICACGMVQDFVFRYLLIIRVLVALFIEGL